MQQTEKDSDYELTSRRINKDEFNFIINDRINRTEGNTIPQVYMPIRRRSGAPDALRTVFLVLRTLTIPKIVILGIVIFIQKGFPLAALQPLIRMDFLKLIILLSIIKN